ncbi:MAG: outer membrane lipoprotein-sorting protein, partial [Candidatus Bipolaricaulia bacterium]
MRGVRVSLVFGLLLLMGASVAAVVSYSDRELTGDEILDRVEEEGDLAAAGSLITIVRFDNAYSDGTTTYSLFGGLSKLVEGQPERTLIYFVEPEDTEGTLFLSVGPVDTGENTHLFLYLPALGSVKELVSEEQREASFAGSTFSYEDVGGADT